MGTDGTRKRTNGGILRYHEVLEGGKLDLGGCLVLNRYTLKWLVSGLIMLALTLQALCWYIELL